ncbi:hypothetical protein [Streptomyces sp. A0642]|uniref:hypothetical protein n=1 Tax=Streptomyces sp. A0642 TaxID=2563100 RepID=UPI001F0E7955|nr:hypothetical protein [Streptomyces sp. A0642]
MRARRHHRTEWVGPVIGGAWSAPVAGTPRALAGPPDVPEAREAVLSGEGGPVRVLDSSGSRGDDDGTGRPRMERARSAAGTLGDGLSDGYDAVDPDAVSTAGFAATAVPRPGAAVDSARPAP